MSHPRSLAVGARTVTCETGGALIGSGRPDWRRHSSYAGGVGIYGSGRNFLEQPLEDGLLRTKTPVIVAGGRRAVLAVPAGERARVGIQLAGSGELGFARATFVPCADKPRTVWPAGLVVRGREPVTLLVRVGEDRARKIRVGRVAGS